MNIGGEPSQEDWMIFIYYRKKKLGLNPEKPKHTGKRTNVNREFLLQIYIVCLYNN